MAKIKKISNINFVIIANIEIPEKLRDFSIIL